MEQKQIGRLIEFDILKGIGMLMVIIGHSFHVWPIYEAVNCVHMPLFFLVSGYFFSTKGTWRDYLSKNSKQLLYPYILLSIIICTLYYLFKENYDVIIYESLLGTTLSNKYSIVLGPVWFFLALFWCRIIYRVLSLRFDIKQRSFIVTIIAFFIVILNSFRDIYQLPFEITQGVVGMFYYHIGVVFKNTPYILSEVRKPYKLLMVSISFILLCATILSYNFIGGNMNLSSLSFPLMPIDLINSALLVWSIYVIVRHEVIKRRFYKIYTFLAWFGASSMTIYFVHCVEYHFSIPFISSIIEKYSNIVFLKSILIVCNPFIQILICIICLYLYNKVKMQIKGNHSIV